MNPEDLRGISFGATVLADSLRLHNENGVLRQQRDELLVELELAISVLDALGGPSVQERKNAAIRGRAAIAKAKL